MKTSQLSNRIVGGENASIPIPWQVHVHLQRNGEEHCGGTILDETTILTAAHCFYPPLPTSADYIEAGISVEASLDGQKISVEETIIHPMFNKRKGAIYDNDVAILKLKSPLTFNENVQPACLPHSSFMPENTRELAVISGWGRTSFGNVLAFYALIVISAAK